MKKCTQLARLVERRSMHQYHFPEESSLFSLFQISLENYFKTITQLLYHLRLQPSEVMVMPYYEYEYILQNLIDILEKKKDAEEGQGEQQKEEQSSMMAKSRSMMPSNMPQGGNMSSGSMPKMPNMSSPSFPSMPSNLKI